MLGSRKTEFSTAIDTARAADREVSRESIIPNTGGLADGCCPGYTQAVFRWRHREQNGTAKSQRRLAATQVPQDLRRGGATEARAIVHGL